MRAENPGHDFKAEGVHTASASAAARGYAIRSTSSMSGSRSVQTLPCAPSTRVASVAESSGGIGS